MIRSKNKLSSALVVVFLISTVILLFNPHSLSALTDSVQIKPDTSITYIELPHVNVFSGSVIFQDSQGRSIKPPVAKIDYSKGIISFERPTSFEMPVTVKYEYLSYSLPEYFYRRKLMLGQSSGAVPLQKPEEIENHYAKAEQPGAFIISGSKSIAVSAGNVQDLNLDQTLNIQIQGQPIEGLTLTGTLSDKAKPQVAGLSSSLEDIDMITLEASAKNFRSRLGDIVYRNDWGGISMLSKRLKGVDAEFNHKTINARATVSGLKGKFKTVSFYARDGVAGPYSLKNTTGGRTSIISGTEKVYLDGRLLQEGATEDYIIDYALGEITFNPRIPLSSRSRIVVDYEYLDQSYRRNFYSGEVGYDFLGDNLRTSIGYLEEGDSRDNPVDFIFSGDDLNIMQNAGDDQQNAMREGGVLVGDGKGNYVREIDSLGNDYYKYVGDSLGDYNVRFSRVDQGTGDYVYLGRGIYSYRGHNNGNYQPFEYLPLPSRNRALYGRADLIGGRMFDMHIKLAGSDIDQNLFSNINDSDNRGFLNESRMIFHPLDSLNSESLLKFAQTGVYISQEEKGFDIPGRSRPVELDRKWALEYDSIYRRADQFEINQILQISKYLRLNGWLGKYWDGNYVSASRNLADLTVRPLNFLRLNFNRSDRIAEQKFDDTFSRIYQNNANANFNYGAWNLQTGWEDEMDNRIREIDSLPGIKFDRYFARLDYGGIWAGTSRKDQMRLDSVWQDDYKDFTIEGGIRQLFLHGMLGLESDLVRRNVKYARPGKSNLTETKSLSRINFRGPANIFSGYLSYRLNRQLVSRLARNFIKVEDGQGEYRLEDSIYVRDPFGDYIAIDELVENGEAGLSSEKTMNLKVDLLKIIPGISGLNQITSETNLNLEEQGGNSYRLNMLYLLPFWRTYPNSRLLSRTDFRQTLYMGTSRGDYINLGFEENNEIDNLLDLASSRYRRSTFEKIYLRINPGFNLRLEHRFKRERENSGYFGTADFGENDFQIEAIFYSGQNMELRIQPRYLHDYSKSDELSVNMTGTRIAPAVGIAGKGRLTAELAYYRVTEKENRFIPFQFAAGNRPGDNFNWGAAFNFKFNKNITAQLKYSGDKIPDLPARHRGTLNMRASF